MIAKLHGELIEKTTETIILDVHNVGYLVFIPLTTFCNLPDIGGSCSLHIQTIVRENSFALYGFLTQDEKDMFNLLLRVSRIGPKTALTVVSKSSFTDFKDAIANQNIQVLSKFPGIGKKTAERIIIELRDKVKSTPLTENSSAPKVSKDAVSALVNLGYKQPTASKAVHLALKVTGDNISLEELIPIALKKLV